MSPVVVVVNPAAGGGRAGGMWRRLEPLAHSLARIEVAVPEDREATREAILRAALTGAERVVVVGGDGTIHLVVNALLAAGAGERVGIGVVPAGTGSDLARVLRLPRHPEEALRHAVLAPLRATDAGRCDGPQGRFYFANIASAGIGGLVDATVNAMPRRGRAAFLLATLRALRAYRCVPVRVTADGQAWFEGRIFLLALANGTTFGKGMRIAPGARIDDGLLDAVLVREIAGWQLVRRLPQVYLGRHLGARPVSVRLVRELRLEPLGELPPFDVDGETYPGGAATFAVLPGALRFAMT